MKAERPLRSRLLAPLVYLAAVLLLLEEWLWHAGQTVLGWLARLPLLRALEAWLARLPPWAALACFVAPAVALFPVKLMALWAIAQGHAALGISVIIAAKLLGTAAVARLYLLTRPALLSLPWFARWQAAFLAVKDRWIARLKATRAWQQVQAVRARLRRGRSYLMRALRRFIAHKRARRRASSKL